MSKSLRFHSEFQRIQVICNGVPLSLNADVEVVITQPTRLDKASRVAWGQLNKETAYSVTVEGTPGE